MASRHKKSTKLPEITNRRARFDYELGDELTAGLVLTGNEVRAARDGRVQLKGSFVVPRNGELWLNNATFAIRPNRPDADQTVIDTAPKKLLLKKKQIDALVSSRQAGYTIVPIKLLTGGRHIKLVIAVGRGKKRFDKRESIKRRDQAREAASTLKQRRK